DCGLLPRRRGARLTAPIAGRLRRTSPPRVGMRRARGSDCPSTGPAGTRARTLRCATAGDGEQARPTPPLRPDDRGRANGLHASDGRSVAALVGAALEHEPAGTRAHTGTKPVGAGALALLGLIGALHVSRTPSVRGLGAAPSRRAARRLTRIQRAVHNPAHSPRTGLFTTFVRDLRVRPEALPTGPGAFAMFGLPGHRGPISKPPSSPRPVRAECSARAVSDAELARIGHRIRGELRLAVSDSTWHIWLARVDARELDGTTLIVEAPDDIRAWVQGRFHRLLQACAERVLGPGARVEIRAPEAAAPAHRPVKPVQEQELNPRMTFEQFVIGDSNRFAHAAALAVGELPGLAYNPPFICGPPGLGKTHLLHSIANYVHGHGGGLTVRYTTVEAFTDHFVGALRGHGLEAFKAAYRGVDVLLVDDVQFLQSKARTEQEFFHTFNALHQAGSQLVLTSDRLPRDMDELEERLRERFEAGLVVDVAPPDHATRLTILRKRVAQDDVGDVGDGALELIADRVDANIRALEGALIRVVAFGSLTGKPVTAELATE